MIRRMESWLAVDKPWAWWWCPVGLIRDALVDPDVVDGRVRWETKPDFAVVYEVVRAAVMEYECSLPDEVDEDNDPTFPVALAHDSLERKVADAWLWADPPEGDSEIVTQRVLENGRHRLFGVYTECGPNALVPLWSPDFICLANVSYGQIAASTVAESMTETLAFFDREPELAALNNLHIANLHRALTRLRE